MSDGALQALALQRREIELDDLATRRLAAAVVVLAVREALGRQDTTTRWYARSWLASADAKVWLELLELNPAYVQRIIDERRRWARQVRNCVK